MKIVLKICAFLLGLFLIALLAIAGNPDWLSACSKYIPSPYRYGDLYMLSNMPGYRIKLSSSMESPASFKNETISLTMIGDSYTDVFDSSYFNAGTFRFIHWDHIPDTIPKPDSAKKNILIVESTERSVRWRFTNNNLLSIGEKKLQPVNTEEPMELAVEINLQYMLTHFNWELSFKELKTSIYLDYFAKFSEMVSKPDGSGRLYLNETVEPANNSSSFNPVEDAEIKTLVSNLNKISSELSLLGFDEVYISIVPNAASIYKESLFSYNHIIERIQQHPDVKFKFIDVYQQFKEEKNVVFHYNDSHWNNLGKMIWLIKTNAIIKN